MEKSKDAIFFLSLSSSSNKFFGWLKEKRHDPAEFSKRDSRSRREILINAYRVVSSLKWRVETRVAKKQ